MTGPEAPVGRSGRFFLPGPTEVGEEILRAQVRPMTAHRGAEFRELMGALQDGLKYLFDTERPVFVSTSSATGLMEAGVRNGASGRVLALVNGAFSERFAHIAEACGLAADRLEVPWGEVHAPDEVASALARTRYDAVTVVHSETSTGALQPVEELARVVRSSGEGTLLLVDSVSGVGGAELHTDAWGLDFVLTASQKALALPPGLALGVASERMMGRSRTLHGKGVYFDLVAFERSAARLETPNTPALTLLWALARRLEDLRRETLPARWARHCALAERTWAWVEHMRGERGVALRVLAPEGARSPTVTAVEMPGGEGAQALVRTLRARGWVIGGGYGATEDRCFRIGHMGEHTLERLEELLGRIEDVLA